MKREFCVTCPLANKRFVPLEVYPSIVDSVDVMFIGEAPGADEEALGVPFVGKSGQLLREQLSKYIFPRFNDISYVITNSVKCRPDNNATPNKKLIQTCYPFLRDEILKYKPKIIVLLGKVALTSVLSSLRSITQNVNRVVETVIEGHRVIVVPTYHPAAILRDQNKMRDFEATFKDVLPSLLRKIRSGNLTNGLSEDELINFKVINSTEEFEQVVDDAVMNAEYLAFDIETFELSPYDDPTMISFSFAIKRKDGSITTYAIPLLLVKGYGRPLERLMTSNIKKIAHNAKFDMGFLYYHGIEVKNLYFDTMIAHHLIDENLPHNLEYLAVTETTLGAYKSEYWKVAKDKMIKLRENLRKGVLTQEDREFILDTLKYNAKDAYATLVAYFSLYEKLTDEKKSIIESLMTTLSKALMVAEFHGVKVDMNRLKELDVEISKQLMELKNRMLEHKWVRTYKSKVGSEEVNLNSTKQLVEIIYNIGNVPVISTTEKGSPSTASDVLMMLSSKYDFIKDLLEYRKLSKLYTAFIASMPEHIKSDGKVHPRFNITGTKTGRLSCESPNMQQIPKESLIRQIFVPSLDYLIEADYSQLELRTTATVSGDPSLLDAFKNGIDLHLLTASRIFGKSPDEVTDSERRIAKGINFGVVYGITPRGLVDNLLPLGIDINEKDADRYIKTFFLTYPKVLDWIRTTRSVAKVNKVVHSIFGVERHLSKTEETDMREAVNFVIQSSSAYMTFFAIVYLFNEFRKRNMRSRIVLTIHDSIVLDVAKEELEDVIRLLKECMVVRIEELLRSYISIISYPEIPGKEVCPLDIEIEIMERWGQPIETLEGKDI